MPINGPHIRSSHHKSFDHTVPSGGCVAGGLVKIGDTVGTYWETLVAGKTVSVCYQADAALLTKKTGSTEAIALGAKVYFEAASSKITGVAGSNTLCGRCISAAAADDTEVLVDFNGHLAS